uniref:NADH-ubiquinone oxidoreductase chain 4 n=1 Tax=Bipes tridactylus TaxID=273520 RepID=Q66SR2_9SAUR|nr:NADH dehydrogenase subunit 4 [Bipes tridactylus]AAT08551.1 NADH dehydrogenase subunit 4 [Bipes tridactylus]
MLKVLIPTLMLIPTSALLHQRTLFQAYTSFTLLLATISLTWLAQPNMGTTTYMSNMFALDMVSVPLMIMSCWLLPLMAMASQYRLKNEPIINQRMFLAVIAFLQTAIIITFSTTELTMFYIAFETTLPPTLMLITRWGAQTDRLEAGTYFIFYTLAASLPMLAALLYLHTTHMHTMIPMFSLDTPKPSPYWESGLLWLACTMAFLVKLPLYGVHLWLPKAHVEAPIAGSMVLAAVLLKLGGYGIIRLSNILATQTATFILPLMSITLWGSVMANIICFRQTDLKSMIAYSSVSHMAMVIMTLMTNTPLGLASAMMLMIAHGLTSSMLFCLANTAYERTNTRTLVLTAGMQLTLPLLTAWWLAAALMNMALPPTTNMLAELFALLAMYSWAPVTLIPILLNTVLTACYSLYMLITTVRTSPTETTQLYPSHTREHLLLTLHLLPLALLIADPTLLISQ